MARHLVVIGGGLAGLEVVSSLSNTSYQITLIDRTNHHLFQPLLYQVAAAALTEDQIAVPLRERFSRCSNVRVLMGEVLKIDLEKRRLFFSDQQELTYDDLVIAVGATASFFGREEWQPYTYRLKTLEDAAQIRESLLLSFELAERAENPIEIERLLRFVIIGGGPTGVELAGTLAELKEKTLRRDFRRIDPRKAQVILLEAAESLLPGFPVSLQERALSDLKRMGVDVRLCEPVLEISDKGVRVEQGWIESSFRIWAAGNRGETLLETLGVPLDRQKRVIVSKDLSIPGFKNVFVIGDAAHVFDPKIQSSLPSTGAAAIQEGKFLARYLKKRLENPLEERTFSYFDKGALATIGRFRSVLFIRGIEISGWIAWMIWLVVHLIYLTGFRNRLSVAFGWIVHYFSKYQSRRRVVLSSYEQFFQRYRNGSK